MRLLALDTALDACAVTVADGDRVLAALSAPMARGHQERLAPMAQAAMTEAGLAFDALQRLAVTVGPGSFTGVRVGLAFAKGLALALDLPCVGVGTLEALAASVPHDGPLAAVLDARRGGVYLQPFAADGTPLAPPEAMTAESAAARLIGLGFDRRARLAGSGAGRLSPHLPGVPAAPDAVVDGTALARLASRRAPGDGRPRPLYLREVDARTLAERAAAART